MHLFTLLAKTLKRFKTTDQPMTIIQDYVISVALASDIGCQRQNNEDALQYLASSTDPRTGLAIVADGMGGHKAGEVASQEAVSVIARHCQDGYFLTLPQTLVTAFQEANQKINNYANEHFECRGMGTTATALMISNGLGCYGHVGDTRLYRIRDGQMEQMTQDHTLVAQMQEYGMITKEQARIHPKKNILTNALGTNPDILVDTSDAPFPIRIGDIYLLCSDGLVDKVTDEEMMLMLTDNSPEQACKLLIDAALDNGGNDNISVIVLVIQNKH